MYSAAKYYLLDSPAIKFILLKSKSRIWVDSYFMARNEHGEFGRSFEELIRDDQKFFEYTRMKKSTFEYILKAVEMKLYKQSNFRKCISPAEKLIVTLR